MEYLDELTSVNVIIRDRTRVLVVLSPKNISMPGTMRQPQHVIRGYALHSNLNFFNIFVEQNSGSPKNLPSPQQKKSQLLS